MSTGSQIGRKVGDMSTGSQIGRKVGDMSTGSQIGRTGKRICLQAVRLVGRWGGGTYLLEVKLEGKGRRDLSTGSQIGRTAERGYVYLQSG